jgi:hypothetical protein
VAKHLAEARGCVYRDFAEFIAAPEALAAAASNCAPAASLALLR